MYLWKATWEKHRAAPIERKIHTWTVKKSASSLGVVEKG
jgi:hypothetical protein